MRVSRGSNIRVFFSLSTMYTNVMMLCACTGLELPPNDNYTCISVFFLLFSNKSVHKISNIIVSVHVHVHVYVHALT